MASNREIVFIHGMYMNSHSWQPWIDLAAARGIRATAPSWPFHEGVPSHLSKHLDRNLGNLNFGSIVNYYKQIIDGMRTRPMLVGHSIGGLVVQKLVNDGFASNAVSVSSAPPQGVFTLDPHFFKANVPHSNPLIASKPVFMTPGRFHYTFCNTMTRNDSDSAFYEFVVPESRNVPISTLSSQGKIDFKKQHVPLYFITGDRDHLTPLSLVRRNVRRYKPECGLVEFKVFADRSHFICNQEGWEEVANDAFDWLQDHELAS